MAPGQGLIHEDCGERKRPSGGRRMQEEVPSHRAGACQVLSAKSLSPVFQAAERRAATRRHELGLGLGHHAEQPADPGVHPPRPGHSAVSRVLPCPEEDPDAFQPACFNPGMPISLTEKWKFPNDLEPTPAPPRPWADGWGLVSWLATAKSRK